MTVSSAARNGKVKLPDRVRETIRFKHYSLRSEQSYVDWIKRLMLFHEKRYPESMRKRSRPACVSNRASVHDVIS